jgi:hypothetical protein
MGIAAQVRWTLATRTAPLRPLLGPRRRRGRFGPDQRPRPTDVLSGVRAARPVRDCTSRTGTRRAWACITAGDSRCPGTAHERLNHSPSPARLGRFVDIAALVPSPPHRRDAGESERHRALGLDKRLRRVTQPGARPGFHEPRAVWPHRFSPVRTSASDLEPAGATPRGWMLRRRSRDGIRSRKCGIA